MYSCNNSGGSSLSIPTGSNRSAVVTPNQKKKTAIDSKKIPIFRKIPIKKKREVSKLRGDKKQIETEITLTSEKDKEKDNTKTVEDDNYD